jgi:hypothetical protein
LAHSESAVSWSEKNWKFSSKGRETWIKNASSTGLTKLTWLYRYDGAGLNWTCEKIYLEELNKLQARLLRQSFGIWMPEEVPRNATLAVSLAKACAIKIAKLAVAEGF